MTGLHVEAVQRLLKIYPDGIFGPLTEEAVKEFQTEHALKADGIVGEKTWAALKTAEKGELKKSTRSISEIIVHCSATPEGKDYPIDTIRQWHKERGFSDIGYHYVVHLDGRVEDGRDVNIAGAHCSGHNSRSIGICYIGGLSKNGKPKDPLRTAHDVSQGENLRPSRLCRQGLPLLRCHRRIQEYLKNTYPYIYESRV